MVARPNSESIDSFFGWIFSSASLLQQATRTTYLSQQVCSITTTLLFRIPKKTGSSKSMSHPITIPIFGPKTSGQQQHGTIPNSSADDVDWTQDMGHETGGDQDMDFDLLAEYLLEDNPGPVMPGMNFDFK
jgi:hypothetical protein